MKCAYTCLCDVNKAADADAADNFDDGDDDAGSDYIRDDDGDDDDDGHDADGHGCVSCLEQATADRVGHSGSQSPGSGLLPQRVRVRTQGAFGAGRIACIKAGGSNFDSGNG